MKNRFSRRAVLLTVSCLVLAGIATVMVGGYGGLALAHKSKHTRVTLNAFDEVFLEQVRLGDLLFHGDPATEKQMGVTLSKTGMACAMCHPRAADTHPYEYPKYQEQMSKFATLRDMTNWCIEKPNQGEKISSDSDAMKALEAYMYWSTRGSVLDPGRH